MTTPNPIPELLAALDNDPQLEAALRQRILTQEILDLPQKIAELTDAVAEMAKVFDRRLTAAEERLEDLSTQQSATNERLDATNERLDNMATQQASMQGQLNNLTGTDYERKVVRRAHRIARRNLNIASAEVLVAINRSDGNSIVNLLDEGADRGIISEDDADELDRTDIILRGISPKGEEVYVVGEISITIDDSDIDRANGRARILEAVSQSHTYAAVIGTAISDANRERARINDVTVVILND